MLTVNLPNQTITDRHGLMFRFDLAPSRKEVLLKGLDDIGTSLAARSRNHSLRKSPRRDRHDV